MKNLVVFFVFTTLISLPLVVFAQKSQTSRYSGKEILVKFDDTSSFNASENLVEKNGARVLQNFPAIGWQLISVPNGMTVTDAIGVFSKMKEVVAVQPNYYYQLATTTPNDPRFPESSMYGLTKISAPSAWDLTTGSSDVVVADIDTGLRYTHEDLADNAWANPGEIAGNGVDDDANGYIDDYRGWDFFFNDSDPIDQQGHGTHTGGTIGARGNNAIGVSGVNWNVKIMAIKIYSATATDSTSAMLINAYSYITMMKKRGINIRVTNNSYGDCPEACGFDQATKDALDAMGAADILNVFAAGNNGRNTDTLPAYPASYDSPSIVSVANSTSSDNRSGSSNFGTTTVDLAAPGTGILSTTNGSNSTYGPNSGTSMASPHVAGAAALLAAYNPSLSAASLKATILNNVDILPQWTNIVKTGGRLNVNNALLHPTVCSFALSQPSMFVRTKGGYFTVDVAAGTNCDFSVKSNDRWIRVEGANSLSGNNTVTFRVDFNPTITRTGTITIAGQAFSITQSRTGNIVLSR